jgi:hypothetical protein
VVVRNGHDLIVALTDLGADPEPLAIQELKELAGYTTISMSSNEPSRRRQPCGLDLADPGSTDSSDLA